MSRDFLSNTELFFSRNIDVEKSRVIITDDEFNHLVKVMRKKEGESIFVTNGKGAIYKSTIIELNKKEALLSILEIKKYKNSLEKISFYVPNLHNKERMRFAVEKLVELGFTNIIIFNSARTVAKGFNQSKWDKIGIAAVKQSLRAFLPNISFCKNLESKKINNLILFDQNADSSITDVRSEIGSENSLSVLIGPEGGLTGREMEMLQPKYLLKLNDYRLRAETAVITAGALLSSLHNI